MKRMAIVQRRLLVLLASIALVMLSAAGVAASQAGFVYALRAQQQAEAQIFGYSLDPLTGALVPLAGFPMGTGGEGFETSSSEMMAYASGRLFVVNTSSNTLSVFAVNPATGALTHLPFSPFALGRGPFPIDTFDEECVAVHPSGSPVVVARTDSRLYSFAVTPKTITAAPGSPLAMGSVGVLSCAFSRDGNFVYAGGYNAFGTTGDILGVRVDPGTGGLTPLPGSPFDSGDNSQLQGGYATDSMGRLFTVAGDAQVRAFTTAGGVPTGVSGNPFPSAWNLSNGTSGVVHPSGFYIVAFPFVNRVGVYQISGSGSGTTLSAVSGSPFTINQSYSNAALALTADGLLVVANGSTRNLQVFQVNEATGNLTSRFEQGVFALGPSGKLVGLAFAPGSIPGDFNGDARSDLLWRNTVTGENIGWLMNGATVSSPAFLPTIADTNWEVGGRGDFNGDRKSDVLWRDRATGQNLIWLMNGLTVSMTAFLPSIRARWEIQGVGDVNADGKADVIWRNTVNGENFVWLMNGLAVMDEVGLPTMTDTNWEIQGVGDFDANGQSDVIWRHKVSGENGMWLMNSQGVAVADLLPMIADTNWEIKGIGDMNLDFKADVIWRHKVSGENIQWLMNGLTVTSATFLPTIADINWEIVGR